MMIDKLFFGEYVCSDRFGIWDSWMVLGRSFLS